MPFGALRNYFARLPQNLGKPAHPLAKRAPVSNRGSFVASTRHGGLEPGQRGGRLAASVALDTGRPALAPGGSLPSPHHPFDLTSRRV